MPELDNKLTVDQSVIGEVRGLSEAELKTYLSSKSPQEQL